MKLLRPIEVFTANLPQEDIVYTYTFFFSEPYMGGEISIFGLFEVQVPHPDTKFIFQSFERILKNRIFHGKVEEGFEEYLKIVNEEIDKIKSIAEERNIPQSWFKTFSAFLGLIANKEVIASSIGHSVGYLFREGDLEKISAEESGGIYFSTINNGSIKEADNIVVLSSEAANLINSDRIRYAADGGPDVLRGLFETSLEMFQKKQLFACLQLVMAEYDGQEINVRPVGMQDESPYYQEDRRGYQETPVASKGRSYSDITDRVRTEAQNAINQAHKLFLAFKEKAFVKPDSVHIGNDSSGILRSKHSNFLSKATEFLKFKFLSPFGKFFFTFSLVLIALLGFSVFNNMNSKTGETFKKEQSTLYAEAQQSIVDARGFLTTKVDDYKQKAKEKLDDADAKLQKITSSDLKDKKGELQETIKTLRLGVDGVVNTEKGLIKDLKDLGTVQVFEATSTDQFYAFAENSILDIKFSNNNGTAQKLEITNSNNLGKVLFSAKSEVDSLIYLYTEKKEIFKFDYKNKTLTKINITGGNVPDASDIALYKSGNTLFMYLAVPSKNQIVKYTPIASGYNGGANYFSNSVKADFSTLVSINIDGGIYTTKSSGEVDYYISSVLKNSDNAVTLASISSITKSYKTSTEANFYTIDALKKVITVFSTTDQGKLTFEKSIPLNDLGGTSVSKFTINETAKRAYFLSDNKLFYANLS